MVLALLASLVFGLWLGRRERFSGGGLLFAGAFLALALGLGMTLTRAAWAALAIGLRGAVVVSLPAEGGAPVAAGGVCAGAGRWPAPRCIAGAASASST